MAITNPFSGEFKPGQVPPGNEERLRARHRNIVEALSMRGLSDIEVEFSRSSEPARAAEID